MSSSTVALEVRPLGGVIGAEVFGVDLASLSDAHWQAVLDLWHEHLVLFFPNQRLSPDDHVAVGRRLGEPEIHPFIPKLDDAHPEIVVIGGKRGVADVWHSDVTFSPTPPMASVLRMATCPRRGGDTMWSNQYAAYESLSAPLQAMLDGLTAVHTATPFGRPDTTARHPAVRVHPVTGRKALYVNRSFTSHVPELRRGESAALLAQLLAWCEQPNFQCRYRWTEGSVAIWDNRCTQHFALGDYDEMRVIERVTVLGAAPVGPPHAGWPEFTGWETYDARRPERTMRTDPRTNSIAADGS